MRLDTGSELGFLFCQHADDSSSNLVMNDRLVVLANNVNTKFLLKEMDHQSAVSEVGRRV